MLNYKQFINEIREHLPIGIRYFQLIQHKQGKLIHKKAGHEIILKRLLTPCEGITDINFPLIVFLRSLTIMRFSKSDFYLVFYPEFCQAIHVTNMLLLRKKKRKVQFVSNVL